MKQIRWGVLGAGGIARRRTIPEGILPATNATLAAVFDVRDCQAIAEQFNARACHSEEELLAQDFDALYIATPVFQHAQQVQRAAAAGKHILCEKPLSLDVDQAVQAVQACNRAGVKFGVGLLMRFHACHRAALQIVREGKLGRPVLGRAQLSCWYPPIEGAWRQNPALGGGGSLIDLGSHCIDLLEMFFGPTRRVWCTTANLVHNYPSEDTAAVLLEFDSGARGIVDCLFNVRDEGVKNRLELYGSEASLLAERTIGQGAGGSLTFYPRAAAGEYNPAQNRGNGHGQPITPAPINTYRAEIEAFSSAILNDTPPPVDGHAGLWSQQVLAACYESARTGRRVDLIPRHGP